MQTKVTTRLNVIRNLISLGSWHMKIVLARVRMNVSNFFLRMLRPKEFQIFKPSLFYSVTVSCGTKPLQPSFKLVFDHIIIFISLIDLIILISSLKIAKQSQHNISIFANLPNLRREVLPTVKKSSSLQDLCNDQTTYDIYSVTKGKSPTSV